MIIFIIIGGGDTGENETCPFITPFIPCFTWGKALDGSPELSHVSWGLFPMGIRGIVVHTDLKPFPQGTKGQIGACFMS